jgi:DNA polymerase-1
MRTLDGIKTAITYGAPYILESLIRKLGPDKVIIVFDSNRHKFRTDLHPEYKHRDPKLGFDKTDFFRQRDELIEIFSNLGLPIAKKDGFEADDIIYQIAQREQVNETEVVVVSGDKDFNQMVNKFIWVWNTSKDFKITHYNMKVKIGYTPEQCVDYLCLIGDDSDNIPGIRGIGEKKALEFLEKFSSIRNFLKQPDSKFGKLDKAVVRESYQLSRRLINLQLFYRKFLKKEKVTLYRDPKGINMPALRKLCAKNEINTFIKPDFIATFKSLSK